MDLSLSIKTPQLIGIILGCIVFWITIGVVVYLLYASGSLSSRLPANGSKVIEKSDSTNFPFMNFPRLYDDLIQAISNLPSKPKLPKLKVGNRLIL